MEPAKILIESLIKAPRRVDGFMFKWMRNVMIDNRRKTRRPAGGEYDQLLGAVFVFLDRLVGHDLDVVVQNEHIFLSGLHGPFFITWTDMRTPNEKLVFEHICLSKPTASGGVDFTHAIMRFFLIILAVGSNDGTSMEVFLKIYDVLSLAVQRAEIAHPSRRQRFAPISTFLRNLAMHPLPRWNPYASIIPMI
jgi:hypothetical protein